MGITLLHIAFYSYLLSPLIILLLLLLLSEASQTRRWMPVCSVSSGYINSAFLLFANILHLLPPSGAASVQGVL